MPLDLYRSSFELVPMASKDSDLNLELDIESGRTTLEECSGGGQGWKKKIATSSLGGCSNINELQQEACRQFSDSVPGTVEASVENIQLLIERNPTSEHDSVLASQEKVHSKDRRSTPNVKKPTKPPRPPKGPSLSASDLKLVREISELTAKKRARVERMRAYRKMKAAKSSSSVGSLTAMIITILFFIVIILQGLCSRSSSIDARFQGSPEPSVADRGMISLQFYGKPPDTQTNGPSSQYAPSFIEPDSVPGPEAKVGREILNNFGQVTSGKIS